MAGTIVADRIQSDDTYPSKIELASPVLVTNEFSVQASGNTGVFNIVGANTSATRTVTLPDEAGTVLTNVSALAAANLTGNVAAARITDALNASGSAPIYTCRAWVNFSGIGGTSVRGSGNVSSVTRNARGDYTMNFATAMTDTNYCFNLSANHDGSSASDGVGGANGFSYGSWKRGPNSCVYNTTSMRFQIGYPANDVLYDQTHINVSIFR
jgi:hypothetical protein